MGIKAKADFPDRVRDVTSYEGMQRRSEQGRNDRVGRLLAGMDRVTITDGKGKRIDVIGRRSGGGLAAAPEKWRLAEGTVGGDGALSYRLAAGRVWDGDTEITVRGATREVEPKADHAFWLEKTGSSLAPGWDLELKYDVWPGSRYEFEGGAMSIYRKRLVTFWETAPSGGIAVDTLGELSVEYHTPAGGDLLAVSSLGFDPDDLIEAVAILELVPY